MAAARKFPGADAFLPQRRTLPSLREAAETCRGCELYIHATKTVFGEGTSQARVVFVGEQPGDQEDRAGRPFVGPAGGIFDRALAEVGISRSDSYVTNAVKHFSFEPRGKARLHKRPRPGEVRACAPWLKAELAAVRPDVLVLLGATAAQSIFGPRFLVSRERGKPLASPLAPLVIATIHPSAVLRSPDEASRQEAFASLVEDLKIVATHLRTNAAVE
ncbi:MAG TPA: UdgX family uracil-DNA binding protein [Polyangiaceae bacterium]|jgi:DNA polymerase|nr:UdgX family uracil-DNA binding protein [Polyangiaceae bacterium]